MNTQRGSIDRADASPGRARSARYGFVVVALLALGHIVVGAIDPPRAHAVVNDVFLWEATFSWTARLVLAVAAGVCFLLGPGLALRTRLEHGSLWSDAALLWVPGFLYLLFVGVLTWLLEATLDPQVTGTVLLVPLPILLLLAAGRSRTTPVLSGGERGVVLVMALLLLIGLGRATWSPSPEGELLAGTVSRTLEVSARPDSRISFNVVQLSAHGDKPYGKVATSYYAPYNFADRGPIAGLASAGTVFTSGAQPPRIRPDQPWEPFDEQGFATFRIMLMLFATTILLGVYGIVRRIADERVARAGVALVALCPFVVHETYFTWPKLFSASFALTALVVLFRRRPLLAGLLLGLGYLAHPGGLLVVPGVVLLWLVLLARGAPGICDERGEYPTAGWWRPWARDVLLLAAGVAVVFVAWRVANNGHVIDRFSGYLTQSESIQHPSIGTWLDGRFQSLGNTLVPFRLFLLDRQNFWVNAFGVPSPDILRFSHSFSATLPFAAGLVYFPLLLIGLARFARRSAAVFLAAIVLPFVGFWIYWGASFAGLLREGLHFWFVVVLIAAFVGHSVVAPSRRLSAVVRWTATLRAGGVLFMLFLPTLATASVFTKQAFVPTDVLAIGAMLAGAGGLGVCSWRWLAPGAMDVGRLPPRV